MLRRQSSRAVLTLVASLERLTHDVGVTRAVAVFTNLSTCQRKNRKRGQDVAGVQRVVTTSVRLVDEDIDDRFALGQLFRVDEIGRAHLPRPLFLRRVRVDRDDLLDLAHAATLDHGESDSSETEDGDVVTLLDVCSLRPVGEQPGGRARGENQHGARSRDMNENTNLTQHRIQS